MSCWWVDSIRGILAHEKAFDEWDFVHASLGLLSVVQGDVYPFRKPNVRDKSHQ